MSPHSARRRRTLNVRGVGSPPRHRRIVQSPRHAGHGALITLPPSPDTLHDTWAVREAVDGLPSDEREVIRLQHLEGFSQHEIAERLALPLGTVKSRSFRAHQRLAARLGYLRGDSP